MTNKTHQSQTALEGWQHATKSLQAVTKHLALLEAANLVSTVWPGREKPLDEIYDRWIGKRERPSPALSDLKRRD